MKKTFALISALICFIFSLCLSACSPTVDSFSMSYFNTHVYVQSVDKTISQSTKDKLNSLFSALEIEFDISNQNSFVYKFNNADAGTSFTLSDHGTKVFKKAIECYYFTDKLFNPAIYPLVELWQFAPDYPVQNFKLPTDIDIANALQQVDFESITFNEQTKTVTKTKANVKLDFGGILKGYACDLAMQILLNDGHEKGYVSVGSSSINILKCEKLDVRHPRQTSDMPIIFSIDTSRLKNVSISSSGDYEKVYNVGDNSYCHIINPFDGKPTNTGVQSVTILGIDGISSDALSTALCLLEHDAENANNSKLISMLKKIELTYPNAMLFVVFNNGQTKQIITNKTLNKDFFLYDNTYTIVNFRNKKARIVALPIGNCDN